MALNKKSISTKFNVILKSFESKRYNNLIIHTVMSIYFDHVFTHFMYLYCVSGCISMYYIAELKPFVSKIKWKMIPN